MEKENDITTISIRHVKGVGPKVASLFTKKDIHTIEDFLYFLPIRYEDKRTIRKISELKEGEKALILARVIASRPVYFPRARKRAFEATVRDDTGSLTLRWFHVVLPYLRELCAKDNVLLSAGKVTKFGNRLQIVHPETVLLETENELESLQGIIPVYSEINGIKQGVIRKVVRQAIDEFKEDIRSIIPTVLENLLGIVSFQNAVVKIHYPDESFLDEANRQVFVKRLIFEEYICFQLSLQLERRSVKKEKGIRFSQKGKHRREFEKKLPFMLTGAQLRVIREIEEDMASETPMNRLLQGDVGSGKTICAVAAACVAIDNKYQVAFMAPTEILAEQHYLAVHRFFDEIGIPVVYLRGNMGKERSDILKSIKNDYAKIVVGTHALLQGDIEFHKLGLVIIDEQHRFGVLQRKNLKQKGLRPDTLVMTATPIPRTLSMVVYGDLDVSVIDEMPAGRHKVRTRIFLEGDKKEAYRLIEEELKGGGQAFIVYPLVEESDKIDLLNATDMAHYMQEDIFPDKKIGLLHGRLKAEEKVEVMLRFKKKLIDILVCTTVIEVGIDIPNASIILIEHSERFGLSQIHQLRGRVGRGVKPSQCILIASGKLTNLAKQRLRVLEKTVDGFQVAEEDLRLRGPGEIFGLKQSGIPEFRLGSLVRDGDIMSSARKAAEEIIPMLSAEELVQIEKQVTKKWGDSARLSDIA